MAKDLCMISRRPEATPGRVSHRGNVTPASSGRVDGPAACTARRGPDGVRGVEDFCEPAKISDIPGLPTGDIPSRKRPADRKTCDIPSRKRPAEHRCHHSAIQADSKPAGIPHRRARRRRIFRLPVIEYELICQIKYFLLLLRAKNLMAVKPGRRAASKADACGRNL